MRGMRRAADTISVAPGLATADPAAAELANLILAQTSRPGLDGRSESQPQILQSECVPALIAALEKIPIAAPVEVIAPTSLRYLIEGATFPSDSPQRRLADLAQERWIWARYALGELETLTNVCLQRAYASLAPLPWPGEEDGLALYTDGGCTTDSCAAAWALRQHGVTLAERVWTLDEHTCEGSPASCSVGRSRRRKRPAPVIDRPDAQGCPARSVPPDRALLRRRRGKSHRQTPIAGQTAAAASSRISGSASRPRQTWATPAALACVNEKSSSAAVARSTKAAPNQPLPGAGPASGSASGATRYRSHQGRPAARGA
jgi:hypothetical protein